MTAPAHTPTAPDRLATYGTLAPGRQNYDQLSDLVGRWLVGTHTAGWSTVGGARHSATPD